MSARHDQENSDRTAFRPGLLKVGARAKQMGPVSGLTAMGVEQLVLTMVFVGSYAFALGDIGGMRRRRAAVAIAAFAAIGCVGFSPSLEAGVVVVALVFVGMGAFAALAWVAWILATTSSLSGSLESPAKVHGADAQQRFRPATPTSPIADSRI